MVKPISRFGNDYYISYVSKNNTLLYLINVHKKWQSSTTSYLIKAPRGREGEYTVHLRS